VFGVKPELVATIAHHHEPVMPDGKPANGPWHVMTYDFQMNPGSGAVPKPLMPAAE
jgi:hydroxyquinol 1,2-dioxygenase